MSVAFAAALLSGCGGGGSSGSGGSETPSPVPVPPADGSYAGTYVCATQGADAVFTAVLPTASGNFSTCRGDVDNHTVTFSCTGSIATDGTFKVISVDTNNVTATYVGEADARTASGTFSANNGRTGTFTCTH